MSPDAYLRDLGRQVRKTKRKGPTSTDEMLAAGEAGRVPGNHRKLKPIDCQCFLPLPTPCFFFLFLSDNRAAPPGVCGLGRQGCPLSPQAEVGSPRKRSPGIGTLESGGVLAGKPLAQGPRIRAAPAERTPPATIFMCHLSNGLNTLCSQKKS